MVDISELVEKTAGNWLDIAAVQNNEYKKALILEEGDFEINTYDSIDKKQFKTKVKTLKDSKIWDYKLNKTSMRNLKVWGTDTQDWVGKTILLKVEAIKIDKDTKLGLIAYPDLEVMPENVDIKLTEGKLN